MRARAPARRDTTPNCASPFSAMAFLVRLPPPPTLPLRSAVPEEYEMSDFDWSASTGSLDLTTLSQAYASGELTPTRVVTAIYDRIAARGEDHVWIHLVERADALKVAAALEAGGYDGRPLWG